MLRQFLRSGSARTLRTSGRSANTSRPLTTNACRRIQANQLTVTRMSKCAQATAYVSSRGFASGDLPSHIKVVLPALSPTMEMGTIVSWEKKEGDALSEGDLLAEIETDKATMGFETPEEGYLAKILVPAGAKNIPLGKLLCIIVSNEEDVAAFKDYVDDGSSAAAEAPKAAAPAPVTPAAAAPTSVVSAPKPAISSPAFAQVAQPGQRVFISPLAKNFASANGLNVTGLAGSGPNGRIRIADVLNASQTLAQQPATASTAAYTNQALSALQSTMASRLSESKSTIPHYYLTVDVEVNQLLQVREQMNALLATESKSKLCVNDFVIKAAALACKQVPEVNSSWQETHIRRYESVDISLAVSTDAGLVTPIVFNAERLGIREISDQRKQLASKAREGTLQPNEHQGGTFTISNLGMYGVGKFSAVIIPPQAAILAVGLVEPRLVPNSNATNNNEPYRTSQTLSVTLSCDHRVVDGAVGARWLQHFTRYLSNPFSMVL